MNTYRLINCDRTLERDVHADSISANDGGVLFFSCNLDIDRLAEITHIKAPGQWSEAHLLHRTDEPADEPDTEQPATQAVSAERLAKAEATDDAFGPPTCDIGFTEVSCGNLCPCQTCRVFTAGWEARGKVRS